MRRRPRHGGGPGPHALTSAGSSSLRRQSGPSLPGGAPARAVRGGLLLAGSTPSASPSKALRGNDASKLSPNAAAAKRAQRRTLLVAAEAKQPRGRPEDFLKRRR
eukprot:2483798-Lingulodinium_polyedra.AAC.1